jgi:uracil-DNA glycosylase
MPTVCTSRRRRGRLHAKELCQNSRMPQTNRLLPQTLANQLSTLPEVWRNILSEPGVATALHKVCAYIEQRLAQGAVVYPSHPFRALQDMTPTDVRVVILGQDPYHGPGQAQGLAFSVPDKCKRPPSLRNIFKEITREYPDIVFDDSNDLSSWAKQGVLLLNTVLTVEDGQAASHAKQSWEIVTDAVIHHVAKDPAPKVFMLWGAHAQAKQALLPAGSNHLVLTANHPSPLSAQRPPVPFLGCDHFRKTNDWLCKQGKNSIDWAILKKINSPQSEFQL